MSKKTISTVAGVLLALLFLPGLTVGQELDAGLTESRIFNVELGFLAGYRLGDEEQVMGRAAAVNFSILENAQVGFYNATFSDDGGAVTDSYSLVRFDYFFSDQISVSLGTGGESSSGSAAGYIGANAILVRSIAADGFSTTLKAGAGYLSNEAAGFDDGTFVVTISGSIGL